MRGLLRLAGLGAVFLATPALAVGLAPLRKQGVVNGPAKAFYLTIINPYPGTRAFRLYVDGASDSAGGIMPVLPGPVNVRGEGQRRVMVTIRGLQPGEIRETRICAELAQREGMIHARVCSTLVARRIAVRR